MKSKYQVVEGKRVEESEIELKREIQKLERLVLSQTPCDNWGVGEPDSDNLKTETERYD